MKKLILFIVIVGLLVGCYSLVLKYGQVGGALLEGQKVRVHRGDLEVPITASGRIEPASIAQIKGKASGEVINIPQKIGEMVAKGDVIVQLDRSDEQRNYDRAKADYDRATIALERAIITKEEAAKVGIPMAQAELNQALARRDLIKVEYDFKKGVEAKSPTAISPQEVATITARYDEAKAAVAAAEAKMEQARIAERYAEKDVSTMRQNVEMAEKQLDETKQRLDETTIVAPSDGMVLKQYVRVGEVVQSGKTSLTGGTVLLDLADVSSIYAVVNVDEADIGLVRQLSPPSARPGPPEEESAERNAEGTPVKDAVALPENTIDTNGEVDVTVESFPAERFRGVIERIAPQSELSAAIATFKVWIRIVSPNRTMLVGLLNSQAEAHFTAKSVQDAILVSYDAFQKNPSGDGFGVYVPTSSLKKYEFRPCEFGRDNGIDVQVIKGLQEGEEVYTQLPQMTRRQEKMAEEED